MSSSTEGTPEWMLRLEQAQFQLQSANFVTWLLTKGEYYGIPDYVIKSQLEAHGFVAERDVIQEELQPPQEEVKRKAGRPRKQ